MMRRTNMRGRAVDRMNGSAARLLHVRMAEPCGGVRAARRWPNCMMETKPHDVRASRCCTDRLSVRREAGQTARRARANAALVGYVSCAKQAKPRGVCAGRCRTGRLRVRREAGQTARRAQANAALVGYVSGAKQAKSMRCVRGPAGRICGAQEVRAVIMA